MDEGGRSEGAFSRPLSAATALGSRLLRSACSRSAARAGAARAAVWHSRVLLLPLLVQRQASAGASLRRSARLEGAGLPVLSLLGQRELDTTLGRAEQGSSDGAELLARGRPRHDSRAHPRFSRPALHPCQGATVVSGLSRH